MDETQEPEVTETVKCRRCRRKLRRAAEAGIGPVCARREATETRTAAEWQMEMPELVIRDPDGWRGQGRSWDDQITRAEYLTRRAMSTVIGI